MCLETIPVVIISRATPNSTGKRSHARHDHLGGVASGERRAAHTEIRSCCVRVNRLHTLIVVDLLMVVAKAYRILEPRPKRLRIFHGKDLPCR